MLKHKASYTSLLCELVWGEPVGLHGEIVTRKQQVQERINVGSGGCEHPAHWWSCLASESWETQDTQSCLAVSKATPHTQDTSMKVHRPYTYLMWVGSPGGVAQTPIQKLWHIRMIAHPWVKCWASLLGPQPEGCKNWVYCLNKCLKNSSSSSYH